MFNPIAAIRTTTYTTKSAPKPQTSEAVNKYAKQQFSADMKKPLLPKEPPKPKT